MAGKIWDEWRDVELELRRMLRGRMEEFMALFQELERLVGETPREGIIAGHPAFGREVGDMVRRILDFCENYDIPLAVRVTREGKVTLILCDRLGEDLLSDQKFQQFLREHGISPT
ncbi:MAG: hypothetical protein HYW91_01395 [Candidatus Sungbacteria bacterium]|nr:hypothetical protein [Candidatus Sungbacteria bacterium]